MLFPDSRILIFCKAPVEGKVKTRLEPAISAEAAKNIHIELALKTISLAVNSDLCPVDLWCHPDTQHEFFQQCKKKIAINCYAQEGDDLGKRMDYALRKTLEKNHSAILIGTDCPSLTIDDFEDGFRALEQKSDVVIGPTEDGGYSLIGLKTAQAAIFEDIDWGTSTVFTATMKNIRHQHLQCFELPEQWDIDRYEDYQRYLGM